MYKNDALCCHRGVMSCIGCQNVHLFRCCGFHIHSHCCNSTPRQSRTGMKAATAILVRPNVVLCWCHMRFRMWPAVDSTTQDQRQQLSMNRQLRMSSIPRRTSLSPSLLSQSIIAASLKSITLVTSWQLFVFFKGLCVSRRVISVIARLDALVECKVIVEVVDWVNWSLWALVRAPPLAPWVPW